MNQQSASGQPKRDRILLMADKQGRVGYEDDGGRVDIKDVIRRHCEQKQKERRDRRSRLTLDVAPGRAKAPPGYQEPSDGRPKIGVPPLWCKYGGVAKGGHRREPIAHRS